LISRIHTYTALATLVNLLVYAVAGIASRTLPAPVVWEQPFRLEPGEPDRAAAERVVRLLDLSLATPVHDFNIGHDAAHRLTFDFYHANGRHKITVLPDRLYIEATRAGFPRYLSTLHVTTAAFHSGDRRMQLWAWYNEFAMWALVAMLATGGWMLATRRGRQGKLRRTHWWTALPALPVLTIFAATAIQMAHRSWWTAGPVWRALNAIHRARGLAPAPLASLLLPVLVATGLCLWLEGPNRRAGAALLAVGALVSGGLIVWMRAG
jgi:hypothetical protein